MQNFEDSDIRELEINQDSFQLYLSKNKQTHKHENLITTEKTEQTTSVKKKANEQPTLPSQNITAPLVGTVYLQPTPDADPYVRSGDHVKKGDVVCVIEAMKMMTEIFEEHLKKDGYLKKAFAGVQGIFLNLSV